jgi:predicted metal-dependent HD superfamily phosphohydrolase
MSLKERFFKLSKDILKKNSLSESWWNKIYSKYSESHRYYHNLTHLSFLFDHFDKFETKLISPKVVQLSIFFHEFLFI